jgi:RNA polymerase sigma factor (TIGR02999 family)
MRGERPGHTLQTSALINEAYLRLVDSSHVNWRNRAHFLAVSAQQMRRVLVDFARSRGARKRGGPGRPEPLDAALHIHDPNGQILDIDQALSELARRCPRRAKVIELRFFGGLTAKETAEVLDVSEDTVLRDWRLARAELLRFMASHADESK